MREKGFIPILILLVIVGISLFVYFGVFYKSSPKPSPQVSNPLPSSPADILEDGKLLGKLAFIRNYNLWTLNNGIEKQFTKDAGSLEAPYWGLPSLWYSNPEISPDGTKVAYIQNSGTDARTLVVSDFDGENKRILATDVEWTMPLIQWSGNSEVVYYPSTSTMDIITVKSVNIANGQQQIYGEFPMMSGCGGGSFDPSDHVSGDENIISVGGGVQIFKLSSQNNFIVHTIVCTGQGLGVLNLTTKQEKTLDDKAMRAAISPDGRYIAAVSEKNIKIFDSTGGVLKTYPSSDSPQVLVWSNDGKTIYFSSSKLTKELNLNGELALNIFGSSPVLFRVNTTTLWKLSIDSGKIEKILDLDAHNARPVFSSNRDLLIVSVENSTDLFDYVNKQKTKDGMAKYYPMVNLIDIKLSTLTPTTLKTDIKQASYLP